MSLQTKDLTPKMNVLTLEEELVFPTSFNEATAQVISGLNAGSSELSHGKIRIQGVAERLLIGDATEIDAGIGVFMGKYVNGDGDDVYGFRLGNPASAQLLWNGTSLTLYGYVPTGGSANDINTNATTISGGKITTNSIAVNTLNFTPLVSTNTSTAAIIATINASAEALTIAATKISISGSTTFSSGYDPSTKVTAVGGNYASAASGARVLIFPDANTGIQVTDGTNDVFKVLVGGTDVGDVIIGDYAGNKGLKWDKSATTFTVRGKLVAESSSDIGASYLSGDVAEARITLNVLAALQTRLSNLGTSYLSAIAANIGTITSGTITGATVNSSSGNDKIVLNTGDYLEFYKGGALKGKLRGVTNDGAAGVVCEGGDLVVDNGKGFMAAGKDANDYFVMGADSSGNALLVLTNQNKFYMQSSDRGTNYFTVSASGTYIEKLSAALEANGYNITGINELHGDDGWIDLNSGNANTQTKHLDPDSGNNYNLGGSSRYWKYLNVKDITKQGGGGFGVFDTGVKMQDGKIYRDTDALLMMKAHPTKKTPYGKPIFDMETVPTDVKVVPTETNNGVPVVKNKDGRYFATIKKKNIDKDGKISFTEENEEHFEGENVFAMMSIMIGAIRELTQRVSDLEGQKK